MISFDTYLNEVAMTPRKPVALKSGIFKGQINANSTKQIKDKNGNIVILSIGDMNGERTININLNGTDYNFPWAGNSYKISQAIKNKSDVDITTNKGRMSFSFEPEHNDDMPIIYVDNNSDFYHFNKITVRLLNPILRDSVRAITQD